MSAGSGAVPAGVDPTAWAWIRRRARQLALRERLSDPAEQARLRAAVRPLALRAEHGAELAAIIELAASPLDLDGPGPAPRPAEEGIDEVAAFRGWLEAHPEFRRVVRRPRTALQAAARARRTRAKPLPPYRGEQRGFLVDVASGLVLDRRHRRVGSLTADGRIVVDVGRDRL